MRRLTLICDLCGKEETFDSAVPSNDEQNWYQRSSNVEIPLEKMNQDDIIDPNPNWSDVCPSCALRILKDN